MHGLSLEVMRDGEWGMGNRDVQLTRTSWFHQSVMLLPFPKLIPFWLAPLLVPICSPMIVCPSRSVSSLKLRGL